MSYVLGNFDPSITFQPVGWRYRLLGVALGLWLMLVLSSVYGMISVHSLFADSQVAADPMEIVNRSLWGVGFATYLVPFGLLGGWISAEVALGTAKLLTTRWIHRPDRRRLTIAGTSALASLAMSLMLSLIFGFQIPYFYVAVAAAAFGAAYLADPWLNRPTPSS